MNILDAHETSLGAPAPLREPALIMTIQQSIESVDLLVRLRDGLRRLDPAWCQLHDAEQISDEELDDLIGELEEAVDAGLIVVGPARVAA